MKRILSLFALMFGLALLAGCNDKQPEQPLGVHRVVLFRVTAVPTENLIFAGTIEPQIKTDKSFRFPGRVASVNVAAGDRIKAGDVLATIDPTSLQLEFKAAQAQFQAAEAQLINIRSMNARQGELVKLGVTPQAAKDDAEGNLAAAESNWRSAQASLDKARNQLGDARLVADYDGIVLATNAEAGQFVSPGTVAVTIARPDERDAVIDIPERYAARMRPDTSFAISRALAPDQVAEGHIREIAPTSDNSTHSQRIYLSIGAAPVDFRIGTMIEARLRDNADVKLLVPATSLLTENGKTYVWKFDRKQGLVTKVEVQSQAWGDDFAEIRTGLHGGDEIVRAGVHQLKDNQPVQPMTDRPS